MDDTNEAAQTTDDEPQLDWGAVAMDPEFLPDCTVRFDEWGGCGINVIRREDHGRTFVDLTFLTKLGQVETHWLTVSQVDQLRAALDAATRTSTAARVNSYAPGELVNRVARSSDRAAGS
jgi:hypothetical protein